MAGSTAEPHGNWTAIKIFIGGHLLWGVKSTDLVTFASVSIPLALLALAASAIPVQRALAVGPATAMRDE